MTITINKKTKDPKNTMFEISGSNVHFSFINALRRTLISKINSFAFDLENITIYKNTSNLNNDQLKHQISMIPILIDVSKYPNLNMNCSFKNESDEFIDLTTADVVFFDGDQELKEKYKEPFIIASLDKNQEINFKASIKFESSGYNGNYLKCLSYYKEIDENKYSFSIESYCFQTSVELLREACAFLIKKIYEFKENINFNLKKSDDTNIHLELQDEDDTIGNLISSKLQYHKSISLASYKKDHPLKNKIDMYVSCKNGAIMNQCISESLNDLISDIEKIQNVK